MTDDSDPIEALYRFYDEAGRLLYVGRTQRMPDRMSQHRREKNWWPEICTITLEWIPESLMHNAEADAIRFERPKYNVAYLHRRPYAPRSSQSTNVQRAIAEISGQFYSLGNITEAKAVVNIGELDRLARLDGITRTDLLRRLAAEYIAAQAQDEKTLMSNLKNVGPPSCTYTVSTAPVM